MQILSIAKPNKAYRWYETFSKCQISANLLNDRVVFYETFNGQIHQLSDDFVKTLFPIDCVIKDRPFLINENHEFYAILNRNRIKYTPLFEEIKRRASFCRRNDVESIPIKLEKIIQTKMIRRKS